MGRASRLTVEDNTKSSYVIKMLPHVQNQQKINLSNQILNSFLKGESQMWAPLTCVKGIKYLL